MIKSIFFSFFYMIYRSLKTKQNKYIYWKKYFVLVNTNDSSEYKVVKNTLYHTYAFIIISFLWVQIHFCFKYTCIFFIYTLPGEITLSLKNLFFDLTLIDACMMSSLYIKCSTQCVCGTDLCILYYL